MNRIKKPLKITFITCIVPGLILLFYWNQLDTESKKEEVIDERRLINYLGSVPVCDKPPYVNDTFSYGDVWCNVKEICQKVCQADLEFGYFDKEAYQCVLLKVYDKDVPMDSCIRNIDTSQFTVNSNIRISHPGFILLCLIGSLICLSIQLCVWTLSNKENERDRISSTQWVPLDY